MLRVHALCVAACVAVVAAATASAATAAPSRPLHVTFVGDSVSASILYTPVARRQLKRGYALTLDLAVCRRLVAASCTYNGSTPTTALQAVQGYGRGLGDVLIVNVGYNESSQGYRQGIDRVMRAALAQGVKGVVWVTLRETRSIYHSTNVAIKTAAQAVAAARRRRLERVLERTLVVRGRRPAPEHDGRERARDVPAPLRPAGRSDLGDYRAQKRSIVGNAAVAERQLSR